MAYDISQLPLRFNNSRKAKLNNYIGLFFFGIIFILASILSLVMIFAHTPGLATWKIVLAAASPWAVLGILFGVGARPSDNKSLPSLSGKKAELTIDKEGVRIEFDADVRRYLWNEIWSAQKKMIHAPGQSQVLVNVVQIRRKGQIIQDTYDDLIDESFGIKADELCALLRQGIERWGSVPQAPEPARPR